MRKRFPIAVVTRRERYSYTLFSKKSVDLVAQVRPLGAAADKEDGVNSPGRGTAAAARALPTKPLREGSDVMVRASIQRLSVDEPQALCAFQAPTSPPAPDGP